MYVHRKQVQNPEGRNDGGGNRVKLKMRGIERQPRPLPGAHVPLTPQQVDGMMIKDDSYISNRREELSLSDEYPEFRVWYR